MACMTLNVNMLSMPTTQLAKADCCEKVFSRQQESVLERPLHMSWVVATGENGSRQLRVQWVRP